MQNNNIIKLLNLQGKGIKIDKEFIDLKNNTAVFYISKKIVASPCPCCGTLTKRIHDHRFQRIKHTPINDFDTFLILKKLVYFVLIVTRNFTCIILILLILDLDLLILFLTRLLMI